LLPPAGTPDLSSLNSAAQPRSQGSSHRRRPPNKPGTRSIRRPEFGVFKGVQQMAALLALITDFIRGSCRLGAGSALTTSFYWDLGRETRNGRSAYFCKINRMPRCGRPGVYSGCDARSHAIKDTGHRRAAEFHRQIARKPDRVFLCAERQFAPDKKKNNLMVHD